MFALPPVPIAPLPDPSLADYLTPARATPPRPETDVELDDGQPA
ncbi:MULTISPECIES: hypothetical protein [unclassified Streptomyces]